MGKFNVEPNELYYSMKHFRDTGMGFQYYEDLEYNGRTFTLNHKKLLHFANCSYLGLEKHPALIDSAIQAVKQYGTQNSMSRAVLSSHLYFELESILSKIFPGHPIVYPTTTLAHCSAFPLLIKEKDAIILDAYVHNSVRMASQLCKANGSLVLVSKHNDMEHVKYLIKRLKKEGYENIWYCADGIYSMHGDVCDVAGLHQLLDEEDNFYAYVDDAHGIGCCGKHGCGYVIGNFGLHEKMIVAGSFSKSIAASGGFIIVPDKALFDYVKLTGQNFIFSAPIAPASIGVLIASLQLHLSNQITRYQNDLVNLILHFQKQGGKLSLPVLTKDITPIQFVKIGSTENVLKVQEKLNERGFFASMAVYPGVSKGNGGIRISLTRHIKKVDIDNLLDNLQNILEIEHINVHDLELVAS